MVELSDPGVRPARWSDHTDRDPARPNRGASLLRRRRDAVPGAAHAVVPQPSITWRLTRDPRDESAVAAELVRRVAAGDVAAEAALVRRYSRRLFRTLMRACGDRTMADDLHQETFGIALLRLRHRGIDRPARLGSFLLQTARNLVIAEFRKSGRRKTDQNTQALRNAVEHRTDQLRRSLRKEEAELVWSLIRELRHERDRELLYRTYLCDDDPVQICADLGLRRDHFRRLLHRARQRFETLLRRSEKRRRLEQGLAGAH